MLGEGECVKVADGRLRGYDGVVVRVREIDHHEYALLRVNVWAWFDVDALKSQGGEARRGPPGDFGANDSFLVDDL